jgi:hypothetical protein
MTNPRECDMRDALQALRYLHTYAGRGILFPYQQPIRGLEAFVDSDWAGDKDLRRSRTGYLILYNGVPISWFSGLQSIVALSSTEAEYIALSSVAVEIAYLRQLLEFIGRPEHAPTVIAEDNRGAIEWVKNEVDHKRSKHIDVKYHYVRQLNEEGKITIVKVDTHDNRADPFTKALTHAAFDRHVSALMANIEPYPDQA